MTLIKGQKAKTKKGFSENIKNGCGKTTKTSGCDCIFYEKEII